MITLKKINWALLLWVYQIHFLRFVFEQIKKKLIQLKFKKVFSGKYLVSTNSLNEINKIYVDMFTRF